MKIVPILPLAIILAAAIPLPAAQPSPRIILHTVINSEWVDLCPTDGAFTYVRIVGGPWTAVATDMLDELSGYQAATVGTTFCTTTLIHLPGGQTLVIPYKVEIDEQATTLEGAVAKAKEKIKAALPSGTFVTPCPSSDKLN